MYGKSIRDLWLEQSFTTSTLPKSKEICFISGKKLAKNIAKVAEFADRYAPCWANMVNVLVVWQGN